MRWEDERYVRVFTRDTADWLALSFDAQGLFTLLLRKVDRAGILPLGRHGKRAVAVVLGHVGLWDRLAPALEELLADGCVAIDGDRLVIPNFVAAQEATMSGALRTREWRERAKEPKGGGNQGNGDGLSRESDEASPEVTSGDEARRAVTSGDSSLPSLPSKPSEPSVPLSLVANGEALDDAGPFERVVEVWNRICVPAGFARAHKTAQQKKAAAARMREDGWLEIFEAACLYMATEPFYRGASNSGWVATLGWLLKPGNSEKTAERAGTTRSLLSAGKPQVTAPAEPPRSETKRITL